MVKRAVAWLKVIFLGLASEFRLVWLALLVVVLALVIVCWLGASEFHIRFAGLVLQWFGLGTVVCGIQKTRELFGHPSYTHLLLEKLSRIRRWGRSIVIEPEPASFKVSAGDLRVHIWDNVDLTEQIQAQVTALTKNVERMRQRLDQMQNEMEAEHRKHAESLRQEQQLREKNDEELRKLLEVAETGGLDISLFGLFFLFIGLFLSTLSPEITQWVARFLTGWI